MQNKTKQNKHKKNHTKHNINRWYKTGMEAVEEAEQSTEKFVPATVIIVCVILGALLVITVFVDVTCFCVNKTGKYIYIATLPHFGSLCRKVGTATPIPKNTRKMARHLI